MKHLIFFFATLNANAAVSSDFEVAIKFDRTYYQLSRKSDLLVYHEGGLLFQIKVQECSRSLVSKITNEYSSLRANHLKEKKPKANSADVEVIAPKSKILRVARGSTFGTWLRDLPKKIMYYDAEARVLCKK